MTDNKETDRNRATMTPGGCECSKCGCIFIGGIEHDVCGICVNELQARIIAAIHDYGLMRPEDGETWESWYAAAFDLLPGKVGEIFSRIDKAPAVEVDDRELDAHLIDRMSKLLAEIALVLNDEPAPLMRPSYHDLPDKVRELQCEVELLRASAEPAVEAARDEQEAFEVWYASPERTMYVHEKDSAYRGWQARAAFAKSEIDALIADNQLMLESLAKEANARIEAEEKLVALARPSEAQKTVPAWVFDDLIETLQPALDYVQTHQEQFGARAGDDKAKIVVDEFLKHARASEQLTDVDVLIMAEKFPTLTGATTGDKVGFARALAAAKPLSERPVAPDDIDAVSESVQRECGCEWEVAQRAAVAAIDTLIARGNYATDKTEAQ